MGRIFISYSRKDEELAEELAQKLEKLGVPVWLDTSQVDYGENWIDSIRRAIADSETVMVIVSPNSAHSEWVDLEVNEAFAVQKRKPLSILPVVVAGEPQIVVPPGLQNIRYFDARRNDEGTIKKLASTLTEVPVKP